MFEKNAFKRSPLMKRDEGKKPLKVTNKCEQTIWPGVGSQQGTGPGTGGFELASGASRDMEVDYNWQGRVWGRTNCTFNLEGTRASNLNGQDGSGAACKTGDCGGVLNCQLTGETPVTLAEFLLEGGVDGDQTFYDISLVDGYNLPMAIIFIPGDDPKLKEIPPNLTNCACIATAGWVADPTDSGTNGDSVPPGMPLPLEGTQTSKMISSWCPWDLQVDQPTKPGDGVYPYPDDDIQRPVYNPCLSACSATNSPEDCCSGAFNSPDVCKPNLYAKSAKTVCPDAYSFAYDDQTSTFIIPTGGGWEVVFCPEGRSTNILAKFKPELEALSQAGGKLTKAIEQAVTNLTYINTPPSRSAAGERNELGTASLGALVVFVAFFVVF